METDWEKYWDRYGDLFWKLGMWRKAVLYKDLLKSINLNHPKILELGCGSGFNSITIAKSLGASKLTLVDINDKALEISKRMIEKLSMDFKVEYLKMDVLGLKLNENFDIVHSDGLLEHFYRKDRIKVFKKHLDFCKDDGFVIIVVPYKCIQYTLLKLVYRILGRWIFDEEPFSKAELYGLCEKFNVKIIKEYTSPFLHKIGILAKKV